MRRTSDPAEIARKLRIEVGDTQVLLRVDAGELADLARSVLQSEGIASASVSIRLVDDAAIHAINRRHLDHDFPTDVITFPMSEPGDAELSGEIVISTEHAISTGRAEGVEPAEELALYVVHGVLHLCGHDDRTEADARRMRRLESAALARSGRPDPWAGRPAVDGAPTGREGAPCSG